MNARRGPIKSVSELNREEFEVYEFALNSIEGRISFVDKKELEEYLKKRQSQLPKPNAISEEEAKEIVNKTFNAAYDNWMPKMPKRQKQ